MKFFAYKTKLQWAMLMGWGILGAELCFIPGLRMCGVSMVLTVVVLTGLAYCDFKKEKV